uniref:Uncharacterized protein n=1 Tax=Phlebotomus papatasi TaxID=29031 RepID=A0A1B0DQL3_PHLPP
MRMRLKIFCGVFVVLCILEYIKAQPDGNDVIQMDYQKSSSTSVKSMGWTEKARSLISGPAGQIVVNLAKEMLSRSTGNSQVLSLNLTNLFVLLFLKALIFSAGLLGTGHWGGGGGYFGRGRSAESIYRSFSDTMISILGHIKEDLKAINLQHKQVEHMSLEEKQFYQFKLHDDDNNDMLDGLEILHSANQHENTFHRIDRDKYYDATEYELQHIVDIIDTFMKEADLDDDGFINYQEYSSALNRVELDVNPEQPLLDDH